VRLFADEYLPGGTTSYKIIDCLNSYGKRFLRGFCTREEIPIWILTRNSSLHHTFGTSRWALQILENRVSHGFMGTLIPTSSASILLSKIKQLVFITKLLLAVYQLNPL